LISDPQATVVLSSLGWVDGDALWRLDAATGTTDAIRLDSGCRYASLHSSGTGRFAVAHHFDGARLDITVRSFATPGRIDARAVVAEDGSRLTGDLESWRDVPLLFVEYLAFAPWKDFVLVRVSPSTKSVIVQRLEWFDQSYDKDYQGVVGVVHVPGTESAVVSVQRSSRLVLHDLETGKAQRFIPLAGRAGNPMLALRQGGTELWAIDYDTLVVVRTDTWNVVRRKRLQWAWSGTMQFIGDFAFGPDGLCVVARPYSGDIVGIASGSLRVTHGAKVGRQPVNVAVLPPDRVVARDWKTGSLLQGQLRPRRWFGG
jgi:hypothetical protein